MKKDIQANDIVLSVTQNLLFNLMDIRSDENRLL